VATIADRQTEAREPEASERRGFHLGGSRSTAGASTQSDYGKVFHRLTVNGQLDCLLESTRPVVEESWKFTGKLGYIGPILQKFPEQPVTQHFPLGFRNLAHRMSCCCDQEI
jgi:hypothetical protein